LSSGLYIFYLLLNYLATVFVVSSVGVVTVTGASFAKNLPFKVVNKALSFGKVTIPVTVTTPTDDTTKSD